MKDKKGAPIPVRTATAIAVPAAFALAAVDRILKEFSQHSGTTSLVLDITQLHVPFEALISVPIQAGVSSGEGRNQWRLKIRAASMAHLYPAFEGVLTLMPASLSGSELELDGSYTAPLGAVGSLINRAFLRGAAQSSLHRFIRDVGVRVTALSRWAQAS